MRTIKKEVVNAFIFSTDKKILFGKSLRGSYEGCWLTPGGGIDDGESKMDALIREVQEETGLDVTDMSIEHLDGVILGTSKKVLKDTGEVVIGEYQFHNFVIQTDMSSTDMPTEGQDDFAEATWHDVATLAELQMPPGSQQVLQGLGYL